MAAGREIIQQRGAPSVDKRRCRLAIKNEDYSFTGCIIVRHPLGGPVAFEKTKSAVSSTQRCLVTVLWESLDTKVEYASYMMQNSVPHGYVITTPPPVSAETFLLSKLRPVLVQSGVK